MYKKTKSLSHPSTGTWVMPVDSHCTALKLEVFIECFNNFQPGGGLFTLPSTRPH
jgi:hypothetical protein